MTGSGHGSGPDPGPGRVEPAAEDRDDLLQLRTPQLLRRRWDLLFSRGGVKYLERRESEAENRSWDLSPHEANTHTHTSAKRLQF